MKIKLTIFSSVLFLICLIYSIYFALSIKDNANNINFMGENLIKLMPGDEGILDAITNI